MINLEILVSVVAFSSLACSILTFACLHDSQTLRKEVVVFLDRISRIKDEKIKKECIDHWERSCLNAYWTPKHRRLIIITAKTARSL